MEAEAMTNPMPSVLPEINPSRINGNEKTEIRDNGTEL